MPACDIRLYGILDTARLAGQDLPALARQAAEGGATILQLRDKSGDTRAFITHARAILTALDGRIPLLINDRVDVTLASGADGVHLGAEDMEPGEARRLLGPKAILGITLKNVGDLAGLDVNCVDYGCIGGVFATQSKDNKDAPIGLAGLADLRGKARASGLPIGAIAGIDAENASACIGAGADGIAVISSLFLSPDVRAQAAKLRKIVDEALAARGANP
jgi:thiamine-phosphate pyrophosphorylase